MPEKFKANKFEKRPEMMPYKHVKHQPQLNENFKYFGSSVNSHPDRSFESTKDDNIAESSYNNEAHNNLDWSSQLLTELDLFSYKVFSCTTRIKHDHKRCPYFHYPKDRRRPNLNYSSDLCEFSEHPENCPRGDSCLKAHSRAEQLYTPEKYRTKYCSFYPSRTQLCEFGEYCSFAHNQKQIRIKLIETLQRDDDFYMFHYKTVFCPYNLIEHDKTLCVYAHNWQDYRRELKNSLNYESNLCPEWKSSEFVKNYEEGGCRNNEKCIKSHGWKESEFHPMNYKTKKCSLKKCLGGKICPYYHQEDDKRTIQKNLGTFFILAPRNRLTNELKAQKSFPIESLNQNSPPKSDHSINDLELFSHNFERMLQKDEKYQHQAYNSNLISPKNGNFSSNEFQLNSGYTMPQKLTMQPDFDHIGAFFGNPEVNAHSKNNSFELKGFSSFDESSRLGWEGLFSQNDSQTELNNYASIPELVLQQFPKKNMHIHNSGNVGE